jgi:Icc-related predicted phosphoesterase
MIRLAAVGDVHAGVECEGRLRSSYQHVAERADVLLLAGDLTRCGEPSEAEVLARELADVPVPVVAVLGNHDHQANRASAVRAAIENVGVHVLEGDAVELPIGEWRLGIAGVKGFGGGFLGRCATEFGEPEMKAFVRHSRETADRLEAALGELSPACDLRVALMHYSPVADTLQGEPPEIHPFLGSYLLAEAVDRAGVDLALHGHAHRGTERGLTAGGVRVRNVAQPVLQHSYRVYVLHPKGTKRAA